MPRNPNSVREATRRFRAKKKCSQLWYTPKEFELVKRAAYLERRAMTAFTIVATLKEARRIIAGAGPTGVVSEQASKRVDNLKSRPKGD